MMALEWQDVDLNKRQLCVQRSDWKGQSRRQRGAAPVRAAHGALAAALRRNIGIFAPGGCSIRTTPRGRRSRRRSSRTGEAGGTTGERAEAGVHILRHTFCSHLAMQGAPARAIQELAGHQDWARRSGTCT